MYTLKMEHLGLEKSIWVNYADIIVYHSNLSGDSNPVNVVYTLPPNTWIETEWKKKECFVANGIKVSTVPPKD